MYMSVISNKLAVGTCSSNLNKITSLIINRKDRDSEALILLF